MKFLKQCGHRSPDKKMKDYWNTEGTIWQDKKIVFSSIKTAQLPGIPNILKNIKDVEMQLFLVCHIMGIF